MKKLGFGVPSHLIVWLSFTKVWLMRTKIRDTIFFSLFDISSLLMLFSSQRIACYTRSTVRSPVGSHSLASLICLSRFSSPGSARSIKVRLFSTKLPSKIHGTDTFEEFIDHLIFDLVFDQSRRSSWSLGSANTTSNMQIIILSCFSSWLRQESYTLLDFACILGSLFYYWQFRVISVKLPLETHIHLSISGTTDSRLGKEDGKDPRANKNRSEAEKGNTGKCNTLVRTGKVVML